MTSPPPTQKFADWLKFQTFGDPQLEKAVAAAQDFASAMKQARQPLWLALCGASGTGKTHIARTLYQWAVGRFGHERCEFNPRPVYWPAFVQDLRAGSAFALRTDMRRWPVLFLDDIGSERDPSGFASEELNTMLGCREHRWTILTSNLGLDGIRKIDNRIADRLIRDPNICVQVNARSFSAR